MTARARRRTTARLFAGLLAAGLLLAGCGSGGDTAGESAGAGADAGAPPVQGEAEGGAGADGGSGSTSAVEVPERKVTRSQVTVEVDDLTEAARQVRELAEQAGGEVSDESIALDTSLGSSGGDAYGDTYGQDGLDPADPAATGPRVQARPGEAVLVLRIPPDEAGSTLDAVAGLGTETGRWTSSTSVESTLVDLETRIESQRRAVEQGQALLARATDLDDVVTLENELNRRIADLESLQARTAALEEQVDRATVTVVLRTPEAADTEPAGGFVGGLRAGWDALTSSGSVLLVVVGALLPWAALVALVGAPLWWWVRRRRAGRPSGPAGPVAPPGSGPPPGPPAGPPATA